MRKLLLTALIRRRVKPSTDFSFCSCIRLLRVDLEPVGYVELTNDELLSSTGWISNEEHERLLYVSRRIEESIPSAGVFEIYSWSFSGNFEEWWLIAANLSNFTKSSLILMCIIIVVLPKGDIQH